MGFDYRKSVFMNAQLAAERLDIESVISKWEIEILEEENVKIANTETGDKKVFNEMNSFIFWVIKITIEDAYNQGKAEIRQDIKNILDIKERK